MDAAAPMETPNGLSVPPPFHLLRPLLGEVVLPSAWNAHTTSQ